MCAGLSVCVSCVVVVGVVCVFARHEQKSSPRPLDTLRVCVRVCVSVCWCWRVCGVFKGMCHCPSVFKGVWVRVWCPCLCFEGLCVCGVVVCFFGAVVHVVCVSVVFSNNCVVLVCVEGCVVWRAACLQCVVVLLCPMMNLTAQTRKRGR